MTTWWKKIADSRSPSHTAMESHPRRVALAAGIATSGKHGSWKRIIALASTRPQTVGSWTRRMTSTGQRGQCWSRRLFNAGGPS